MSTTKVKLCDGKTLLDRYALLHEYSCKNQITNDELKELHELYHKLVEHQDIRQRLEKKIKENEDTQKSIKSKLDKMDDDQRERNIEPDVSLYDILEGILDELAANHEELLVILKGEWE